MIKRMTVLKENTIKECTQKHLQNNTSLRQDIKKCENNMFSATKRKQLVQGLFEKHHDKHLYIELIRFNRKKKDIFAEIKSLKRRNEIEHYSFCPNEQLQQVFCSEINEIGMLQETVQANELLTEGTMQFYIVEEKIHEIPPQSVELSKKTCANQVSDNEDPSRTLHQDGNHSHENQNLSPTLNDEQKQQNTQNTTYFCKQLSPNRGTQ
ncbi:uncharacterized protein LOC127842405 [Dreissena polymorpha]|uniref:uncharacterized protein LOC127842405 n=1 Tax=Dreissena polymorpha TaxID=45954 RepID=UPI002263DFBA|nr:uncharacterized protein LOC127842405 [Dreissena polymorpha]